MVLVYKTIHMQPCDVFLHLRLECRGGCDLNRWCSHTWKGVSSYPRPLPQSRTYIYLHVISMEIFTGIGDFGLTKLVISMMVSQFWLHISRTSYRITVSSWFHYPFSLTQIYLVSPQPWGDYQLLFPVWICIVLQENMMKISQMAPLKTLVNSIESTLFWLCFCL